MHRQQIAGIFIDLINGRNVTVVVDKLDDIPPILNEIEHWDGRVANAKVKIYRAHGRQAVRYAGNWIRFASARSPRGLRGLVPEVIVVDELSPGIHLSRADIAIIENAGAERVPMLH